MRGIEPYAGLTLDPCEGTGWLTVVDLEGVHVSACIVCNASATRYPTTVPRELRDQVLDAINERRQLLDDGTPAEGQEPTAWDQRPTWRDGDWWPVGMFFAALTGAFVVAIIWWLS